MSVQRVVLFFILMFSLAASAWAQDPVKIVRGTTAEMLSALDKNRGSIQQNPEKLERLVRQIVLPHVDLTVMARSIVGRKHWLNATAQQRKAFEHELVGYVVRTYSSAFSAYRNQQVQVFPYRGSLQGKDRVVIQSRVIPAKGNPISVDYRLLREQSGWKVYDISVDGVSMIRSYRAQFAEILDQKGLSGLTQELKEKQQQ